MEVIIFILTEILVIVDSSGWPYKFFIITMVLVFILNVASGIYQNTLYGIASKLPPQYTGAVILGNWSILFNYLLHILPISAYMLLLILQNICGISISVLNILARIFTQNQKEKAIYYFLIALVILFLCFGTYFILPLTKFYKYYSLQFDKAQEERKQLDVETKDRKLGTPYWKIFKGCSLHCFNIFFTYFVTMSLYPKVQSNIQRIEDSNFFIGKDLYADIMCFISFSVFATLGNLLATVLQWPGPKKLHFAVIMRCIFIPLFLLCNYNMVDHVENLTPVYKVRKFAAIFGDIEFGMLGMLMAFTGGYFSSISMMFCCQSVPVKHISVAGMLGGACIVSGIFIGLLTPFIWPYIIFE